MLREELGREVGWRWWVDFPSRFHICAHDDSLHVLPAASGFPATSAGSVPSCSQRGSGCRRCPYGSKDQRLTHRPIRVGCVQANSCPSVGVVPAAPRAHHLKQFGFFASGAEGCFCSESPRIGCTPAGLPVLPWLPAPCRDACVSKARSTASGISSRDHTRA